ncbi:hypothetical protein ACEN2Q_23330 [Bremerella cremea]|uniref:hypothetical protein n=1 Tax=Bremerella cremea TaxID=1031537 RepID=UPI00358DB84B
MLASGSSLKRTSITGSNIALVFTTTNNWNGSKGCWTDMASMTSRSGSPTCCMPAPSRSPSRRVRRGK